MTDSLGKVRGWTTRLVTCAYCGAERAWPDGFPISTYAKCWRCAWDNHVAEEHKSKRRRFKRGGGDRLRRPSNVNEKARRSRWRLF